MLGVIAGALVAFAAGRWRRPAVILAVALLIAVAAATGTRGAAICLLPIAMGAANAVFQRDGEVSISVTYMTGTLVKLGQHLAGALARRERAGGWWPYLLLWAALMAGALAGALVYPLIGVDALWPAVGFALLLAGGAWRLGSLPVGH